MSETEKKIMSTTKMEPGELQKFSEAGLGDAPLKSEAERELYRFQNGGDPARLALLTGAGSHTASRADQAATEAAVQHYRRLQTAAREAVQQRADAECPQYTDQQVTEAEKKIQSIRLGLTLEATNFKKILLDASHVGHREVSEEWSRWHQVANAAKR